MRKYSHARKKLQSFQHSTNYSEPYPRVCTTPFTPTLFHPGSNNGVVAAKSSPQPCSGTIHRCVRWAGMSFLPPVGWDIAVTNWRSGGQLLLKGTVAAPQEWRFLDHHRELRRRVNTSPWASKCLVKKANPSSFPQTAIFVWIFR